ncbi:MAG: adenosylcobinamide-GDP ribazoletransferase [Candidatus Competibacteraceae bacterium]|nr:adenosylcobinamide-GDP ribazoletransferase [Candidatus Competibacteraceae bacterium]
MRPLALALQLLTRLPVPALTAPPQPWEFGQAVLFFPFVGLLIGALLAGLHMTLWWADPGVLAALALAIWVSLTGGLHLDGLADTADAWIGGQGDRERTLAIMKDPRSGPMAITAIVLVLLSKFTALQTLLVGNAQDALWLAPMWGRAMMVLLLATTPYARPDGLGSPYADQVPRWNGILLAALIALATLVLLEWSGGLLVVVLGGGFLALRQAWMTRLGGVTGDTLGATCELMETLTLLTLALLANEF